MRNVFRKMLSTENKKENHWSRHPALPALHDKPDNQDYCRKDQDGDLFDDMEKGKEIAPGFIDVHPYLPPWYAILQHACAKLHPSGRAPVVA